MSTDELHGAAQVLTRSGVHGATVGALAFNQPREPGTFAQYGKGVAVERPAQARGRLVGSPSPARARPSTASRSTS